MVKGSCDYLSWASAVSYLQTLRDVRLVYLPGGHNTYQDAPAAYLAALRAFLSGGPLTPAPHTGTAPPPGYEGPP